MTEHLQERGTVTGNTPGDQSGVWLHVTCQSRRDHPPISVRVVAQPLAVNLIFVLDEACGLRYNLTL